MADLETIKIIRDVKAIAVPFGDEITLAKDTEVIVLQALGNSYTVIAGGQTVMVDGSDADALGLQNNSAAVEAINSYLNDPNISLEDKIWSQLKTCYDPEIPINIVDLGLIYEVTVEKMPGPNVDEAGIDGETDNQTKDTNVVARDILLDKDASEAESPIQGKVASSEEKYFKAIIHMTLTAPGCGMGPVIAAEAKQKVLLIPQIKEVELIMVFDPPWDRSRLSDAAKLALGLF